MIIKTLYVTKISKYLSSITHYGAYTLLLLTLELLFLKPLWLLHLALLIYFYAKERDRWQDVIIIIILHAFLTLYLYGQIHYKPSFNLNQAKSIKIYTTQDVTPNALERAYLIGYSQWVNDGTFTIYQALPVRVTLSNLHYSLPRGSIVEIHIGAQSWREPFWYISTNAKTMKVTMPSSFFWHYRSTIKDKVSSFLEEQLGSSYGLYLATTLGDRSALSPYTIRLFRESGLAHLLALSGLHASLLIILFFFTFKWLPIHHRLLILIPVIIFHAWLTAFLYTLMRAYLMAIIALFAKKNHRKIQSLDLLALSTILILIWDWQSLYSLSFHLSFLSVMGILLFYKPITHRLHHIRRKMRIKDHFIISTILASFAMSFAVELVINPLILASFQEIQLFSFLSNLFVPLLFLFFFTLASITLFIPSIRPLLHSYESILLGIIDVFNIYLLSPPWIAVLVLHILLALSLFFWHNNK